MVFDRHSELEGMHAFLSPSQYHWINYTDDKLIDRYLKSQAVERGTELHAFAHDAIRLNRRQRGDKDTVNMFINDAIGFKMASEQPLFYDYECFGTADAISYKRNYLRIHDLKTGETEAHMEQLRIYAALFCLNYQARVRELRKKGLTDGDIAELFDVSPKELHFDPAQMSGIELRIYQLGEVRTEISDPKEIRDLMDIIISHVEVVKKVKAEVQGHG